MEKYAAHEWNLKFESGMSRYSPNYFQPTHLMDIMTGTDKHSNGNLFVLENFPRNNKNKLCAITSTAKIACERSKRNTTDESMYRHEPNHLSFLNFYLLFDENGAYLWFVSRRSSLIAFILSTCTHCIIAIESIWLEWYNQRFAMIFQIEISIYF